MRDAVPQPCLWWYNFSPAGVSVPCLRVWAGLCGPEQGQGPSVSTHSRLRVSSLPTLAFFSFFYVSILLICILCRPGCVKADPKVIKFYRNLQCSKPVFQQSLSNMIPTDSWYYLEISALLVSYYDSLLCCCKVFMWNHVPVVAKITYLYLALFSCSVTVMML